MNSINQYTSAGGASPSYNSRGDLTGINGWSFSYDAFGNLSTAQSDQCGVSLCEGSAGEEGDPAERDQHDLTPQCGGYDAGGLQRFEQLGDQLHL